MDDGDIIKFDVYDRTRYGRDIFWEVGDIDVDWIKGETEKGRLAKGGIAGGNGPWSIQTNEIRTGDGISKVHVSWLQALIHHGESGWIIGQDELNHPSWHP